MEPKLKLTNKCSGATHHVVKQNDILLSRISCLKINIENKTIRNIVEISIKTFNVCTWYASSFIFVAVSDSWHQSELPLKTCTTQKSVDNVNLTWQTKSAHTLREHP